MPEKRIGVPGYHYYRPQTKFAKVMFLHLSVSHSVHGGGSAPGGVWSRGVPGPEGCLLRGVPPPGGSAPGGVAAPGGAWSWVGGLHPCPVFTPVCQSFCSQGGSAPGGAWSWGGGDLARGCGDPPT